MTIPNRVRTILFAATGLVAVAAVACGSSSTPAATPTAASPPPAPSAPSAVAPTVVPSAPAPVAPTAASPAPAPAIATPTALPETTATEPAKPAGEAVGAIASYSWEVSVIDDNGAKPSLALAPDGTPHIAFLLEAQPGFVKHAVLDASGWDITTVDTGYLYGPLDVQVDSRGVPHIAWHNHDTEDAAYAKLVDGEWQVSQIKHPGHDGWDTNLAIDSQGRPHVTGIDPVQFGSQSGVEHAVFDGQSWTVESISGGPQPYEFGTFVVVDSQDRPHVVWFDDNDKDLKYSVKNGDSWETSTVDSQGDVGRYASMALDSQGNPAISYYEASGNSSGYIKLARWNGNAWDVQRIDRLDNVFTGFFGARKNSSLVLDGDDNPIVVYSDEQIVKLAWWDGSDWNLETVQEAQSGAPFGQQVSMGIDTEGVLHLTFADVKSKGRPGVKGSIKYAVGTRG